MSTGTVEFKVKITDDGSFKKLEIDAEGFNAAIKHIKSETDNLSSMLNKLTKFSIGFNQITELANKVGEALRKVVDVGASDELQKLNLTTLFKGNADAAAAMFSRISQYGKETVYDKEGLIDAQKTMMSFGISGEQAFTTLKQIGDIAMGDGQKMQSLALAFSQATSTGKLMGQDLLQMINAGFNPLAVISEHTGESMASLKEKMSQGAISAEMLAKAFAWATEEGSLFYKGAESAGNTTEGKINQLRDTYNEFLVDVFNQLQPVINAVLDFSTNVLNAIPAALETIRTGFGNIIDTISDFSGVIIGVTAAVASLTIAINANKIALAAHAAVQTLLIAKEKIQIALTNAWKTAQAALNLVLKANPIGLIISAIALLVGAIATVVKNTTGWGETWESVVNYINKSLGQMGAWFKLKWLQISDFFLSGIEDIMRAWYKLQALWDKDAAAEGLASMQSKAEERAKAIAEQKEVLEGKKQERKETTVTWAVKWERKSKRDEDSGVIPDEGKTDADSVRKPEPEPNKPGNVVPTPKKETDKRYNTEIQAIEKTQRFKENELKRAYEQTGDRETYESSMETVSIESLEKQREIAEKYGKDTTKVEQSLIEARIQHKENEYDRKVTLLNKFTEEEKDCLNEQLENKEITQEQHDIKVLESDLRNSEQRLKVAETYNQDTTEIIREQQSIRAKLGEAGYSTERKQLDDSLAIQKAALTRQLLEQKITQEQHDRLMLVETEKYYKARLNLADAYGKAGTGDTQAWLDARLDLQRFDKSSAEKKGNDTTSKSKSAGDAWNGVKGVADSFRDIKDAITDTDNAWDRLTKTVDAFVNMFKSSSSVIESIKNITAATKSLVSTKKSATAQTVISNTEETVSETAKATVTTAASEIITEAKRKEATLRESLTAAIVGGDTAEGAAEVANAGLTVGASQARAAAKRSEATANALNAGTGAASSVASIPFVGPILAVGAVASVIASFSSLPKFATGAVVYGPTIGLMGEYGGAKSNPEVIAPLDRLRALIGGQQGLTEVKFRIEGRELVGILNKQNNIYKRNG